MPSIPLGRSTSKRNLLPDIRHRNMYAEASQADLADGVVLRERPSLVPFTTAGTGPVREIVQQFGAFSGNYLVVSGTQLFRVTAVGDATLVGTVPTVNRPRITIGKSGGADVALIGNVGALLQTDGVTVTAKTFPMGNVMDVNYINGYYLAVPAGSSRVYYTDLVTGEFDAARFIGAERSSDAIVRIEVTEDEIWAFGATTVEVFVPTGVDATDQPPFQRVQGRVYERGTFSPFSVQKADNTIVWVDTLGKACRGESVPIELPNQDGVFEFLSTVTALNSFLIPWNGHTFWVMTGLFGPTIAYDFRTQQWNEWASFTDNSATDPFRISCACAVGSILGDATTNALYRLAEGPAVDRTSDPIVRTITGAVAVEGRPLCSSVSLMASVGMAPPGLNPSIRLRISDDQGKTWVDCGFRSLGRQGEYTARPRWTRLGQMRPPMRIFEWTLADAAQIRVSDAQMNTQA